MLRVDIISVCYTVVMTSEKGCHNQGEYAQRPQRSLHIVSSVAGVDCWHALWDWLLAPAPPTEPSDKELEVADDDN